MFYGVCLRFSIIRKHEQIVQKFVNVFFEFLFDKDFCLQKARSLFAPAGSPDSWRL